MYFLYILECKNGSLYTGITTDVGRRFLEHQKGSGGHYTRSKGVSRILYTESHTDKSSALKREFEIKGWTRAKKLRILNLKI